VTLASCGCMAAKPDTAKLTETLSDLEDYLPTVRCVLGSMHAKQLTALSC
jgi:hypothetical protein